MGGWRRRAGLERSLVRGERPVWPRIEAKFCIVCHIVYLRQEAPEVHEFVFMIKTIWSPDTHIHTHEHTYKHCLGFSCSSLIITCCHFADKKIDDINFCCPPLMWCAPC